MGRKNYFGRQAGLWDPEFEDFDIHGSEGYWEGGIYYPHKKKPTTNVGATSKPHASVTANAGTANTTYANYTTSVAVEPKLFKDKKVLNSGIRDFVLKSSFEHIQYFKGVTIPDTETNKIIYAGNGIFECVENSFLKVSTKIGEFHFPGFENYSEYLEFKIPKIPRVMIDEILALDKAVYAKSKGEFYAAICWNFKDKKYYIRIPKQEISGAAVTFEKIQDTDDEVMVLDHHSHNVMGAFFSGTDDNDDSMAKLKIAAVFGQITSESPAFNCRVVINGVANTIALSEIIEPSAHEVNARATVEKLFKDKIVSNKVYNPVIVPGQTHIYKTQNKSQNVNKGKGPLNVYQLGKLREFQIQLNKILDANHKNIKPNQPLNSSPLTNRIKSIYADYCKLVSDPIKVNVELYVKMLLRTEINSATDAKGRGHNLYIIAQTLKGLLDGGVDTFIEIALEELNTAHNPNDKRIDAKLLQDIMTSITGFDELKDVDTLICELELISQLYIDESKISAEVLGSTLATIKFITIDLDYEELDEPIGTLIQDILLSDDEEDPF